MPDILVGMNAHPLTEITLVGVVGVHAHKMFAVHKRVRLRNFSFVHYWKFERLKYPSKLFTSQFNRLGLKSGRHGERWILFCTFTFHLFYRQQFFATLPFAVWATKWANRGGGGV